MFFKHFCWVSRRSLSCSFIVFKCLMLVSTTDHEVLMVLCWNVLLHCVMVLICSFPACIHCLPHHSHNKCVCLLVTPVNLCAIVQCFSLYFLCAFRGFAFSVFRSCLCPFRPSFFIWILFGLITYFWPQSASTHLSQPFVSNKYHSAEPAQLVLRTNHADITEQKKMVVNIWLWLSSEW